MSLSTLSIGAMASPFGLGLGFFAGLAVGVAHFLSLRRSVAAFTQGGALIRLLGGQLARIAISVAALAAVAISLGAIALLAAGVGFLIARTVVFGITPR